MASDLDYAELVNLASKIPQILKCSISQNTFKSYSSGFRKWSEWCKKYNLTAFPVEQRNLLLFMSDIKEKQSSVQTLNSVLYSISWIHGIAGLEDPCKADIVVKMKEGAKRILSRPCTQKEPLTIENLVKIVSVYGQDKDNLPNLRFVTMCVVGFYGFFRFDELFNLKRSNINFSENYIEVNVERSKTDTLRHGSSVSIAATGEITCPKLCLLNYFEAAKIPPDSENFIFRPIIKTSSGYKLDKKRKLSYTRTREIFLERLQDLGLDKSKFGLHSLRSGGASAACKAGVSDRLIMKHGRWKSEKSKDRYIHETVQQKLSVTKNI